MTVQSSAAVQGRVAKRKRLVSLSNMGLTLIVLSVPLQFVDQFWPLMLACAGSVMTGLYVAQLRKTIGYADLPATELDEYMLQLHVEARDDGLKTALMSSLLLLLACGAISVGTRFVDSMDGVFVAVLFFKLILLQMLWIPVSVAQSLAGKFNRDELISKE